MRHGGLYAILLRQVMVLGLVESHGRMLRRGRKLLLGWQLLRQRLHLLRRGLR